MPLFQQPRIRRESSKKETWQSASKGGTFSARISFVSHREEVQGYKWVQTVIQPTIFPPRFFSTCKADSVVLRESP